MYVGTSYSDGDAFTKDFTPLCLQEDGMVCVVFFPPGVLCFANCLLVCFGLTLFLLLMCCFKNIFSRHVWNIPVSFFLGRLNV